MKVNFGALITNLLDDPMTQNEQPLTLGVVASTSLLTDFPKTEANVKVARFKLAQRIFSGEEVNLEVEEIAEIKKVIGMVYPPLIVGRSWQILEGE